MRTYSANCIGRTMSDDDKLFGEAPDWGVSMSNVPEGFNVLVAIRDYADRFISEEGRHVPIHPPVRILPYETLETIATWAGVPIDEVTEGVITNFVFAHTTEDERLAVFMGL